MYFDLSKPQQLFADSVRDFCQREFSAERVRELMETESATDDRLWQEFADQGWLGLHISDDNDGLGLGTVDLAVLSEEFGRACVPGPWLACTWAATLLQNSATDFADNLLSNIVNGTNRATVAVTEDDADWHMCWKTLQSELVDGRLNGRKQLVQHAAQSDQIVLPVRGEDGLALVAVPTSSQGVNIELTSGMDATRTLYQVTLTDVNVTDTQLLATGASADAAWASVARTMEVVVSAEMLGLQQWMLAETVEYAKTRKQFDKTIGAFQAVQHKCAEMLQLAESARAAVWYAAWAVQEHSDDADKAVAVAKSYTSDAARTTGNLAVQCHGGIGFTWEHDLHLYYKRAKADEFLLGDGSFHREKIGAAILA